MNFLMVICQKPIEIKNFYLFVYFLETEQKVRTNIRLKLSGLFEKKTE
jgi:hypothetical protein